MAEYNSNYQSNNNFIKKKQNTPNYSLNFPPKSQRVSVGNGAVHLPGRKMESSPGRKEKAPAVEWWWRVPSDSCGDHPDHRLRNRSHIWNFFKTADVTGNISSHMLLHFTTHLWFLEHSVHCNLHCNSHLDYLGLLVPSRISESFIQKICPLLKHN